MPRIRESVSSSTTRTCPVRWIQLLLRTSAGSERVVVSMFAEQYSRRDYDYRRNACVIEAGGTDVTPDSNSESGFSSGGQAIDDIYAGTISGSTRLTEWSVSARAGYDFGSDRLLWGPRVSITYLESKLRPFTESGRTSVTNTVRGNGADPNTGDPILVTPRGSESATGLELAFDEQSRTSLQSEVQLVAAYRFDTGFGALIPRVSGSWIHEFRAEPARGKISKTPHAIERLESRAGGDNAVHP